MNHDDARDEAPPDHPADDALASIGTVPVVRKSRGEGRATFVISLTEAIREAGLGDAHVQFAQHPDPDLPAVSVLQIDAAERERLPRDETRKVMAAGTGEQYRLELPERILGDWLGVETETYDPDRPFQIEVYAGHESLVLLPAQPASTSVLLGGSRLADDGDGVTIFARIDSRRRARVRVQFTDGDGDDEGLVATITEPAEAPPAGAGEIAAGVRAVQQTLASLPTVADVQVPAWVDAHTDDVLDISVGTVVPPETITAVAQGVGVTGDALDAALLLLGAVFAADPDASLASCPAVGANGREAVVLEGAAQQIWEPARITAALGAPLLGDDLLGAAEEAHFQAAEAMLLDHDADDLLTEIAPGRTLVRAASD